MQEKQIDRTIRLKGTWRIVSPPRICAAAHCERAIHPSLSFCRDHFALVPAPYRKAIWACVEGSVQECEAIQAAALVVAQAEGRR